MPPISSKKNLDDYVTERSALLLERFCPGYDAWLTKNPPWDGISEYEEAKVAIRAICPVNDPGERLCAVAKRFKVCSSCVLRDCTPCYAGWSVGWLVGRSVCWSPFYFFGVFERFEHMAPA